MRVENNKKYNNNNNTSRLPARVPFFFVSPSGSSFATNASTSLWPLQSTTTRRPTMARAREEESELHNATGQKTPLPRAASTEYFTLDDDGDVLAARPHLSLRCGHCRVQRHAAAHIEDIVPYVQILDVPVPQLVDKLEDVLKIVDLRVPAQEIEVPKIFSLSRPPLRRVLPVPQVAEQLVEVPVPVPSFSDWVRWEETYRRTGRTWLGGFECGNTYWARPSSTPLVPRSLFSSSSTEWWRSVVAAVPTVTQSANCAVLGSAG